MSIQYAERKAGDVESLCKRKRLVLDSNMLCKLSVLVGAAVLASQVSATECPSQAVASCSEEASTLDSCCVSRPGGLFFFRQRFEADEGDEGRWGIDGLDVLNCDGSLLERIPPSGPRAYDHEQIASFCARSARIGPQYESYESEWAASEVGESVEEIWDRSWRVSGRQISTLDPKCFASYEKGQEVPAFFDVLHQLHSSLPSYQLLADSDITPSEDTTYSLEEIVNALSIDGLQPYLTCINDTLSAIHWPFHALGPFQDGNIAAAEFDESSFTNCPSTGIVYPPAEQIIKPSSYTWDPLTKPTMRPLKNTGLGSENGWDDDTGDVAEAFVPHEKKVVQKKLGLFKKKDEKLQVQREREFEEDAKRHKRDEL